MDAIELKQNVLSDYGLSEARQFDLCTSDSISSSPVPPHLFSSGSVSPVCTPITPTSSPLPNGRTPMQQPRRDSLTVPGLSSYGTGQSSSLCTIQEIGNAKPNMAATPPARGSTWLMRRHESMCLPGLGLSPARSKTHDQYLTVNHADRRRMSLPVPGMGNSSVLQRLSDSWLSLGLQPLARSRSRKCRQRLLQKNGECNISNINILGQKGRYFSDFFTSLMEFKWRYIILLFSVSFLLTWIFFTIVNFVIALANGDFQNSNYTIEGNIVYADRFSPCFRGIRPYSFASMFLFTIESQQTIGYGSRHITEDCPSAIITLCLQCISSVMISSFFVGVVFAKFARPRKRAATLMFSRNAVICMRDGVLCFLFRCADMRRSLVEAHLRVQLIQKRVTAEGEVIPFNPWNMDIGFDDGTDRILMMLPQTICHEIDEESPLYKFSAHDIMNNSYEVVVILEGIVESTGMTTQARTSYVPSEILWGHRFAKLIHYKREDGRYRLDYASFDEVYPVETIQVSAYQLHMQQKRQENSSDESHHGGGDESSPRKTHIYNPHNAKSDISVDSVVTSQYSESPVKENGPRSNSLGNATHVFLPNQNGLPVQPPGRLARAVRRIAPAQEENVFSFVRKSRLKSANIPMVHPASSDSSSSGDEGGKYRDDSRLLRKRSLPEGNANLLSLNQTPAIVVQSPSNTTINRNGSTATVYSSHVPEDHRPEPDGDSV